MRVVCGRLDGFVPESSLPTPTPHRQPPREVGTSCWNWNKAQPKKKMCSRSSKNPPGVPRALSLISVECLSVNTAWWVAYGQSKVGQAGNEASGGSNKSKGTQYCLAHLVYVQQYRNAGSSVSSTRSNVYNTDARVAVRSTRAALGW
jgi:hypothetical protein